MKNTLLILSTEKTEGGPKNHDDIYLTRRFHLNPKCINHPCMVTFFAGLSLPLRPFFPYERVSAKVDRSVQPNQKPPRDIITKAQMRREGEHFFAVPCLDFQTTLGGIVDVWPWHNHGI